MVAMTETQPRKSGKLRRSQERPPGFTLLELLLVMALLVLFVGGLGYYQLQTPGRSRLDAAARQVSFVLTGAQAHAQAAGVPIRVLVEFAPSHPEFLRLLHVVQWRDGQWVRLGGSRMLPRGVAVVPSDRQWLGPKWNMGSGSVFSRQSERIVLDPDGWGPREFVFIEFRADGLPDVWSGQDYGSEDVDPASMELKITLSASNLGGEQVLQFLEPTVSRELRISARGDVWVVSGVD